jgi:ATP-binding cassette, subfamily B, bacterial HlyB/CyaB
MCIYRVWLTLIVAISLPLYALVSMTLNPILRERLNHEVALGADVLA